MGEILKEANETVSLPTSAAAAAKSLQSCPTLRDSMDCSLPGSSVHGIFQAGVLEWGAIALSLPTSTIYLFHEWTTVQVRFFSHLV